MAVKINIDFKFLDGLLKCGASVTQCANIIECSTDTVEKRIKEKTGMTFKQYRSAKLDGTRLKLINKALNMATSGNVTMMIFCLKNLCNWSDKRETEVDVKDFPKLKYDPAKL